MTLSSPFKANDLCFILWQGVPYVIYVLDEKVPPFVCSKSTAN